MTAQKIRQHKTVLGVIRGIFNPRQGESFDTGISINTEWENNAALILISSKLNEGVGGIYGGLYVLRMNAGGSPSMDVVEVSRFGLSTTINANITPSASSNNTIVLSVNDQFYETNITVIKF